MVIKCLVYGGYGQGAPGVLDLLGRPHLGFTKCKKKEKKKEKKVKIKKEEKRGKMIIIKRISRL